MKNNLKCSECCYFWEENGEAHAYCHWESRCPDDKAPCEYDDSDYTESRKHNEIMRLIEEYAKTYDMNAIEILLETNGYKYHHEAMARGYVSRKTACTPLTYNGRFGKGITLEIPAYNGTQYHYRQYWIKTA